MKNLDDMSLEELWLLFPISLTAPNPLWTIWAVEEITNLQSILGSPVSGIHHIGSTAINGIWAKPIIDILVETADITSFNELKSRIIYAGYICMNETNHRLDFNKGYTHQGFAERVFHLHLRLSGDNDELYFRDYLNSHPDVAIEYEQLKLKLWKSYENDRDGYTRAKTDFVKHYTALAKSEYVP